MSSGSRLSRLASSIGNAVALFFRAPPTPDRRPAWPPHGRLALGALAAVLALAVTVIALDARSVAGARMLPSGLVWLFQYITGLGLSGWFLIPIAIALLTLAAADAVATLPDFSRRVLATISIRLGFVFMAIAMPGLFTAIIKRLIGRARPFVAGEDPWTSLLWVWRSDYASFPSGHATTAFAAAVAIGAVWPWLRPLMWTYAVVIAVSRVIVVAHHPSDVIAGAIVGAIGALLMRNWYASRRLGFAVATDGTVFKLPGPSPRRVKAVARQLLSA
jgi:membrane-associated phospholipid phosphatase